MSSGFSSRLFARTTLHQLPRPAGRSDAVPRIPGRELLGEVATRRLWSVCRGLGAVLLETTEEAGLAGTAASEALGLDVKTGAVTHRLRAAGPSSTGRAGMEPSKVSAMDTRQETSESATSPSRS